MIFRLFHWIFVIFLASCYFYQIWQMKSLGSEYSIAITNNMILTNISTASVILYARTIHEYAYSRGIDELGADGIKFVLRMISMFVVLFGFLLICYRIIWRQNFLYNNDIWIFLLIVIVNGFFIFRHFR